MTMTHDQLHTHGPDELAMLRAECDKWHKAYDRVWEERMRFADRAIELEKENSNLKRDNEQLLLRADNWKSLCVAGEKNIAELKDKLQAAENQTENLINSASSLMLRQDNANDKLYAEIRRLKDISMGEFRWRKCSQELPEDNTIVLGIVIRSDKSYYYALNYRSRGSWVKTDYPEYWMPLPPFKEADK